MALKIRLRQQGRKNRPFYRIVVADSRSPRDGKFLEILGWYNPFEEDQSKGLDVKEERITHWINEGALITEKVRALVKKAAPNVIAQMLSKQVEKKQKKAEKKKVKSAKKAEQPKEAKPAKKAPAKKGPVKGKKKEVAAK